MTTTFGLYNGTGSPGVTAYPAGTDYAAMTDSALGINDAAAAAFLAGERLILAGTFRIDSTVTIMCNADLSLATFICNDTTITAVRAGSRGNGAVIYTIDVKLPKITNAAQVVGSGWTGTSVGVEIANLNTCRVTVPYVRGFTTGVKATSYGAGCSYSRIDVDYLNNNKVNFWATPGTSGYVTELNVYGGRYGHISDEGVNVPGVRQVLLSHPAGGVRPDNIRFWGASFEGDVPEYHVECDGLANLWDWCRWEASPPKVLWTEIDANDYACDNRIRGGIHSDDIVVTTSANARRNYVDDERGVNVNGQPFSHTPVLMVKPNADIASNPSTTAWVSCINATIDEPRGTTWTLTAVASANFRHTTGGEVDCKITIDGTDGLTLTEQVESRLPGSRIFRQGSKSGVASGPRTVTFWYKVNPATPGIVYANNPSLTVNAERTG